jgi:hypothetical protein
MRSNLYHWLFFKEFAVETLGSLSFHASSTIILLQRGVKFSSSFKYLAYRTLVLLPVYIVVCMIVFAMIVFTVVCMHDSNMVLCCS